MDNGWTTAGTGMNEIMCSNRSAEKGIYPSRMSSAYAIPGVGWRVCVEWLLLYMTQWVENYPVDPVDARFWVGKPFSVELFAQVKDTVICEWPITLT